MRKFLTFVAGAALVASPFMAFAEGTSFITVPTSTQSDLTANVSSTVADPGLLLLIILAAGIPLTFYVIHQLIGLIPKSRGRRQ